MMQSLQPDVLIAKSQHKSLKRLVADAFRRRDRVAPFLSAEVRRAALCDDAALPDDVVALHREVSFQLDRSPPTPYRILVFPADFNDPETQINILSPLGAALLGLRRGDVPADPTTKACAECLSVIPVAAKRCAFCTSQVS